MNTYNDDFNIDDIEWGEITSPLFENKSESWTEEDWDTEFRKAFRQVCGEEYKDGDDI